MFYTPHKKIALFFLGLVGCIFVLIIIFFLTRTTKITIIVKPKPEAVLAEKIIKIPNNLSAELINISFEQQKTFQTKNGLDVPGKAEGQVEIFNNSNQKQTLIKTTRLLSKNNLLFRLAEQMTVPAHSKVMADVYADKEGKEFEIEPTTFTIPGLSSSLQKLIYAESKEKMVGGATRIGLVTEPDLAEADKILRDSINQNAEDQIKKKIEEKNINLSEWKVVPIERDLQINFDAKADDQKGEFTGKGTMKIILLVFEEEKLNNLVKKIAQDSINNDKQLKSIDLSTLKHELVNLNLDEQTAELDIKVKITTVVKENSQIFDLEKLKNMNAKDIKNFLEQYKEIDSVKIVFYPFWKNDIPQNNDLIKIKILSE